MAKIRWPRRNLGAQSENWGRTVEQNVDSLLSSQARQDRDALNNSQQTNAAINNLTTLVTRLQEQQEQLIAQQAQLAEQQDQILDLVKTQTSYVYTYANFDGPWSISNSAETQIGSTFITVPAGYTNVALSVIGGVGLVNPLAVTGNVAARIRIDWPDGSDNFSALRYQTAGAGWDLALTPAVQRTKSSLSGGQKITIRVVLRAGSSTPWPNTPGGASVNIQATFTR